MRNCQRSATTGVDPGPGADVQAGTEHMHVPDPANLNVFHACDAMKTADVANDVEPPC